MSPYDEIHRALLTDAGKEAYVRGLNEIDDSTPKPFRSGDVSMSAQAFRVIMLSQWLRGWAAHKEMLS